MRVLWFNHRDPLHPLAGGAEVRVHEIGKRLVQMGCSVRLICERWRGSRSRDLLDGIEIVRTSGKYGIHLRVPFILSCCDKYDVVVDDVAHAVPWFSPLFTSRPVIGQVHHVHQEVLKFELSPYLAGFVALAEGMLKHFYKALIAVSESTKHDLVTKLRIPEERIKVVPNGVDTQLCRPMMKRSEPTLLWAGRVKKYKRIDHALLAFRLVKSSFPECSLYVVGDGDYLESLRKLSIRLGLSDVIFTGRVDENEKLKLMASSWGVLSTSFVEGWGMAIVESAACGTPAIVYDVSGLRDSVCDNYTGLIVEDGNITALARAAIKILGDEQLRLRLSDNAFNYAQTLSWNNASKRFMKALEWAADKN